MSNVNTTRILATADSFTGIEEAVKQYFKTPVRLIFCTDEWCVCASHDLAPFGTVHRYYVVRQGARYRLEMRKKSTPPIHHRPQEEAA